MIDHTPDRVKSLEPTLWSDSIFHVPVRQSAISRPFVIGVLEGEGIGRDVIHAALKILPALGHAGSPHFRLEYGGPIGAEAESAYGMPLTEEVVDFCHAIFSHGGAILCGPGGGRFVYDLRKRFDLFCKLSPLKGSEELADAAHLKSAYIEGVDILLIRENVSGIYQGTWNEEYCSEGRLAEQRFSYSEKDVQRIMDVAARLSQQRTGRMMVVIKDGGIPAINRLWRDCATDVASRNDIVCSFLNIDYAAYLLIQEPRAFDVVVTSNLFGDILADLGGVLLGSRGLSYSGNFSSSGAAVYQTNHGSAYDLVGKNQANPVGQMFSLSLLLRESFGLVREASLIQRAVGEVWRQGWRTADLAQEGCRMTTTTEMGDLVAENVIRLSNEHDETCNSSH